jgi:uncharacterized protein (DUF488 family)
MDKYYTIGYGGWAPQDFLDALIARGVTTIVDVRLRPDRAYRGTWVKAKTPEKGIERLLASEGIKYAGNPELFGNPFIDVADWRAPYQSHVEQHGPEMVSFLLRVEKPFALMCAERKVTACHRQYIAACLARRGWDVEHIE